MLLLVASLLAGCSATEKTRFTPPPIPAEFPKHSVATIIENVHGASGDFETLKSKSRIRFETPDRRESVNLNIQHRRSDSLVASVRVTFGIEAARALVTRDSFFVYERVSKKLYFGEAHMINAFFPTPAPLDELFPSMTGMMVPGASADWQVSSDSLYYYLASSDGTLTYKVDPRIWRVVQYTVQSPAGEVVEERIFAEFDLFDSRILPRRIEAVRPGEGRHVWIYHRSIELNPEELSLSFKTGGISEKILVGS
jgi:hypothetical protein